MILVSANFCYQSERRNTKRRIGLVRVLYLILGGRGRLPMKTWPLVNRICEPCVSVFDPPNYVLASLRRRMRVSEKLEYDRWCKSRSLSPQRASRKSFRRTMGTIGMRPRTLFRMTPR